MAEVQQTESGNKRKRKSTRVDMTAMVDVAFLLLTFFILTTTLAQPGYLNFVTPEGEGDPQAISQEKIMTLILAENDEVYYYKGMPGGSYVETDFSEHGIRDVIQDHLHLHPDRCGEEAAEGCWDPIFVIKPQPGSRYKNLVDALDELRLSGAPKYTYGRFEAADSLLFATRLPFE